MTMFHVKHRPDGSHRKNVAIPENGLFHVKQARARLKKPVCPGTSCWRSLFHVKQLPAGDHFSVDFATAP